MILTRWLRTRSRTFRSCAPSSVVSRRIKHSSRLHHLTEIMNLRTLVILLVAVPVAPASVRAQAPSSHPNVVLIITDDVGYGDFGAYGSPDVRTPNIDRLAREGVKLTDFYANGSNCSPTRAGLMSGRYQQRFAIERPLSGASTADSVLGLPATGRSLPQLLLNSGYATGLIGKWHLGYRPEDR